MYDNYKAEHIYQQWIQVQQGTPRNDLLPILMNELGLTKSEASQLATKLNKKYQENRLTA